MTAWRLIKPVWLKELVNRERRPMVVIAAGAIPRKEIRNPNSQIPMANQSPASPFWSLGFGH